MGSKWSHSYEAFAHILEDGPDAGTLPDSIQVRVGTRVEYFAETPDGLYKPQFGGSASSLTYDPASSGVVTYVTQDRTTHVFDRLANDSSLQLTSFSDVNGGQFQLSYDPSDRLTGVTDTRGKSFSFDYTSGGLLRSVRSDPGTPNEARVSFGYDVGAGVLNSITDLDGRITTFTTTDDSRILTGTNDDGVTFVSNSYEVFDSIAVDQQGNRVASRRDGRDSDLLDPDAGLRLTYDGDTVISTDRLVPARRESRQYDAKGRVAAQIDQTGVRTEYDYDRNNNRIETRRQLPSEPDPRILSKSDYDNRSNLLRAVDFPGVCIDDPGTSCANDTQCPGSTCGVTQSMTYDLDNNLRSIADHYGHRTSLDFDVSGNLVRERDPLGNEITLTYGAVPGRTVVSPIPESATNARGFSSFNELDSNGYLIRTVDPSGGSVSHTWDSRGRRNSTTDPLGHKTCLDYDEMGRVVRIRALCDSSSEFVQSSMTYDADGRELSRTDADGATSRIDYTTTGRVQARIDPLGRSDRYSYDLADRVTNIEKPSPSGRVGPTNSLRINTAVNYDDGDRPTDLTESFGNCVGGDPGATGQACTVDADCPGGGRCGVSVRAEYDEIGNLVRVEDPNGNVRRFEYDLLQRIVAQGEDTDDDGVIDPGSVERGTYDGRGLQTTLTTPRNQIITYRYDDAGRTTGRNFDGHALTHVMDGNGNRTLSVLDGAAVTRAFDPLDRLISRTDEFGNRVDAVRDLSGQLTELVYPSDLNGDGQRDKVIYGYDDLGRMTSVEDWDGNRTTYGYDRVGRLVRATLPDGNVVTYRYDAAGRLIEISDPGGEFAAAYTLNEAGLRTKASLSLPLDPSIPETDVTYAHGPRNELLSSSDGATFTYDESGNLVTGTIGGSPVAMTHNALNQLESINGESYRYDADGLRIETDRNGVVHRYVYDMVSGVPRVLEEQDESGKVVSRYVHGVGLISRKGPEGLRVYHHDSRGSTVSLTDGSGTVTDRYAYDPFGKLAGHTGGTIQPFRYNGRDGVFDDDNGLYYMSARYYAPELQRFIEMDQAFKGDLTDTQSLNRYAFVVGDPIQLVDPDGEWGWIAIGALVGAAVGGITSTVAECLDGCKWDEALGAAAEGIIAGAITGAVLAATGGAVAGGSLGAWGAVGANAAAGAVAAAVGNAANQGITIAGGSQDEFNFVELGVATAAGLVVGAVSGGVSVGSQAATLSARAFPTRSLRALQSANFQGTLVRDLGSKAGIGLQLLGKVGGKILPEYETLPTLPKNSYAGRVLAGRAFQSERQ
jgi:RHS repeat-associated protein